MGSGTLVIIPTYNERDNLPQVVDRLMALPVPVDMLVVDDNSPDGTGVLADEMASANKRLHVLHRQSKEGLGRAYCAGFQWALANGFEVCELFLGAKNHDPKDPGSDLAGMFVQVVS